MKSKKTLIKKKIVKRFPNKISKEKMKELKLLPKWKKLTGGLHNQGDGQVVKKDGFLYAEEWEIPKRCKEAFEFVRAGKKKTSKKKAKGLRIVEGVEKGTFDVLNADGESINDSALTKEEAGNLVEGQ